MAVFQAIVAMVGVVVAPLYGFQAPTAAVLEGVVVSSQSGRPIMGATVTVESGADTAGSVATDAVGHFRFEDLTEGPWSLKLVHPDFVMDGRKAISIALRANSEEDLRLEMTPAGAISGRILDADDQPVISATVVVLKIQYDALGRRMLRPPGAVVRWTPGDSQQLAGAVTDEEGRYRISGLEPGSYHLAVWATLDRDLLGDTAPVEYYPGVIDPANAIPLAVGPGVELGAIDVALSDTQAYSVRFEVSAPPCSLPDPFEHFYVVRHPQIDAIVSGDSIAVAGAFAEYLAEEAEDGDRLPERATPLLRTGDNGWLARGFYPGIYDIYYSACDNLKGRLSVDVVDGDVDAGTLTAEASGRVEAAVFVSPEYEGQAEVGRLGFSLLPIDSVPPSPDWLPMIGTTFPLFPQLDASGASYMTAIEVPPGRYMLRPRTRGQDAYLASVRFNGREAGADGVFEVGSLGGRLEAVFDGPGGVVQGIVQADSGEPVSAADVVLVPEPQRRSNPSAFRMASTDEAGAFVIRGVAPGAYSILAWEHVEPNAYLNAAFLRRFESRAADVRVENGAANNLRLTVIAAQD